MQVARSTSVGSAAQFLGASHDAGLRPGAPCRGPRLRAAVASALRARNAPHLVFRHDGLTPQQQEAEEALLRLDAEVAAEAAAVGSAPGDAQDGGHAGDATLEGWEQLAARSQQAGLTRASSGGGIDAC